MKNNSKNNARKMVVKVKNKNVKGKAKTIKPKLTEG